MNWWALIKTIFRIGGEVTSAVDEIKGEQGHAAMVKPATPERVAVLKERADSLRKVRTINKPH